MLEFVSPGLPYISTLLEFKDQDVVRKLFLSLLNKSLILYVTLSGKKVELLKLQNILSSEVDKDITSNQPLSTKRGKGLGAWCEKPVSWELVPSSWVYLFSIYFTYCQIIH